MRVMFWTEHFWPYIGGVEIIAARFLPALKARGHEIVVVTSMGNLDLPEKEEFQGMPVYRLPFQRALHQRDLDLMARVHGRLVEIKKEFKPDVVYTNVSDPSVLFHLQTERLSGHRAPLQHGVLRTRSPAL